MGSGRQSGTELTERILAEMQLAAPGLLERTASRDQLRKRIHKLVAAAGYPTDPPQLQQVTLLQAELRGFSALIERYPAGVVANMLNRYLALMTEVVGRYGGTVDRLQGDTLLVVFGAPLSREEHVQQALVCAVEMQHAMARCNQQNEALRLPPLYMGIGIHSGEVVAGAIGAPLHQEYTVFGPEVHLVSAIAALSLRGQVLLSENSYRLAREFVLTGEPSKFRARGRAAPVALYELLGTTRPRAMSVPRREVRKSPRVRVQVPCYFQCVEGPEVLDQLHCGQVVDLGYHGLRMISPVRLDACGEIRITLSLQLLGRRTSDAYARILQAEEDVSGYRCSMEFIDIDLRGQQALKEFVDSRLSQV